MIDSKNFKQIYENIKDLYNFSYVLKDYCENNIMSEDLSHIVPLVKLIYTKIDDVYARIIDIKY